MNRSFLGAIAAVFVLFSSITHAQVPPLINYQGRVVVGTTNFDGSGQFKFALVNAAGTTAYWSNDGSLSLVPGAITPASQPTAAVSLLVTKGLYSLLLGDTTITNMTALPGTVFTNSDVRLRVWFNDSTNGSQLLTPDQRLGAVGYAFMADNIKDGAITSAKLATGAVGAAQLAPGAILSGLTIAGATQVAQPNTNYAATSASLTTITLPTNANVGDVVQVSGVGTGGWAFDSSNGQQLITRWIPRASTQSWGAVASSADGSKLVAVVRSGQVYTSTDSGVNWTPQASAGSRNWSSVASSADGSKLVAVVSNGQIYTSTDSGVNWMPQASAGSHNWQSVASSADGSKLVAVAFNDQIYTSTDSGVNWTPQPNAGTFYWTSVASSADGNKLVAVGISTTTNIYTSTDSGVNWTARDFQQDCTSVASSADGSKLLAATMGEYLYISTDSGVNWTPQASAGSRNWSPVASSADGSKLVAATAGGNLYTSTDSGVNWTPQASAGSHNWQSVASSADGSKLVALPDNDTIYTRGTITGTQGSNATVQYLGNGLWKAVEASQIAAGAVGPTELGQNAVSSANIAPGAVTSADLASGLTLAGTTTGTFSGPLTGNASTATSATGFSGSLAGNVTGPQTNTVVATVGSVTAANVASGANLANAATNANTASAIVKRDASGNFSAGTISASLNGNASTATNFTGSLAGEVTGPQGSTAVFSVGGVTAANVASGANLANGATTANTPNAIVKRDGSGNFSSTGFSGSLAGDVTGIQGSTVVASVGSVTAANVASGANLANAATTANTANAIVKRDASGNFSAGTITASLTGTATNFSGSLAGGVTGTQGATVVALVGGVTAANVASGASAANAATNANTASLIVRRDASGNFSAGTITASLAGTATNFSGMLAGEVTGTQGATSILATAVTSKTLTGFSSTTGTVTASDTVLSAIDKLYGNDALKAPLISPSFTGAINIPATVDANNGVIKMAGTALISAPGSQNVFLGNGAGNFTFVGQQNTGAGVLAMNQMTGGSFNSGVGYAALYNNGGSYNTGLGYETLYFNSGNDNTAMGHIALMSNTTGSGNVALGNYALNANNVGANNVAVGANTLYNTKGSGNIGIGNSAGVNLTTDSNNIDIGNAGVAGESNAIRIGTPGTHTATYLAGTINGSAANFTGNVGPLGVGGSVDPSVIVRLTNSSNTGNVTTPNVVGIGFGRSSTQQAIIGGTFGNDYLDFFTGGALTAPKMRIASNGNVGIGTSSPSFQLQITGSAGRPGGGSWTDSSDLRLKQNIQPMQNALGRLMQLHGVNFQWRNPQDHANQSGIQGGFIAQEVEAVFPNWITEVNGAEYDRALTSDGKIKSLSLPFEFDALVVESIKQQQAEIAARDSEISALKQQVADLKQAEESQLGTLRNENAALRDENAANAKRLATLEARDKEREARLTRIEMSIPPAQAVSNTIAVSKTGEQ